MKKKKEVLCQIKMGEGMITVCGTLIRTSFDKKGIPSYDPKYTLSGKVTCENCLHILHEICKKHAIAVSVRELSENKKVGIEKPVPPVEPIWMNYQTPKESNGKNFLGEPLYQKLDWVKDMEKYTKDLKKYEEKLEIYGQLKLIRFIKNADEKLILRKYKITKK